MPIFVRELAEGLEQGRTLGPLGLEVLGLGPLGLEVLGLGPLGLEVLGLWLEVLGLRLGLSLASEEVEEVEAGGWLAEDSGLDTKGIVRSVELNSSELGSLDIATELGCGNILTILLTDAKTGLEARADAVSISIVDSAGNKASDAAVTASVQLDSSSEGCAETLTIAHLGGHSQLGDDLAIGVHCGPEAGSEAQVTVSSEQAVSSGHSPDSAETSGGQGVLESLARVGGGQQTRGEEPGVSTGGLALGGEGAGVCWGGGGF